MKSNFYPICSTLKISEGGISKKDILFIASLHGLDCKVEASSYVGCHDVLVKTENKRKIDAFIKRVLV